MFVRNKKNIKKTIHWEQLPRHHDFVQRPGLDGGLHPRGRRGDGRDTVVHVALGQAVISNQW